MDRKKIGVIDSGIGGLTLVKVMQDQKFDIDCYYICDHENVPYGEKSQDFMLAQIMLMVDELIENAISDILIACNTLTVKTIDILRAHYPKIKFVGIEPFIKYLTHPNAVSVNGVEKVGLILTMATFNSERFQYLQQTYDGKKNIDVYPLRHLAELIENLYYKKSDNDDLWLRIKDELNFIHQKKWTHIILGCTHYPMIRDYFEKEFNLFVIDPHLQVLNHLRKLALIGQEKGFSHFNFSQDLGQNWQIKKI